MNSESSGITSPFRHFHEKYRTPGDLRGLFLFLLLLPALLLSQDDSKPWERLGLSLTEWKLIQENNLPMSKVERLLKDGIGIGEYFSKPWEQLGMSESKWIAKRRSGLTSYDIELQVRTAHQDTSVQSTPPNVNTFRELDRSRENGELFASFFLPGYLQYREKHKGRGSIMVSLAVGSIAGCTAWSVAQKQFMPLPLLVVLIPDMVWSFVDHKVYRKKNAP
ncbi:MAG: hypothetical protein JW913_20980 [Chitinispirillaceae bacterium]|nr:hypothetical protein [Chitinispirillaceae bacterium]